MEKFKPVLKFFGIFIVTIIALIVIELFCRAVMDVLGVYVSIRVDSVIVAAGMFIVPVIVAWKYGLIDLPSEFRNSRDTLSKMALPILAGLLWFYADNHLVNLFDIQMPDEVQGRIDVRMHSPYGLFSVCILKPVLEELMFRTVILGLMLRSGVKPWVAIILSAFLFGASHLNMCQFVHSGVGGLMLGFVYYKTNNVFATIIIHAIHNSWVTFLGLIMEGLEYTPDSSYDDLVVKLISVSLMVAFASASILIMKRFISRYPQPQFVENEEPDEPVMEEC